MYIQMYARVLRILICIYFAYQDTFFAIGSCHGRSYVVRIQVKAFEMVNHDNTNWVAHSNDFHAYYPRFTCASFGLPTRSVCLCPRMCRLVLSCLHQLYILNHDWALPVVSSTSRSHTLIAGICRSEFCSTFIQLVRTRAWECRCSDLLCACWEPCTLKLARICYSDQDLPMRIIVHFQVGLSHNYLQREPMIFFSRPLNPHDHRDSLPKFYWSVAIS